MVEAIRLRVSTPLPKIRARVLPSLLPTQVEIRSNGTTIQWRHVDGDWMDLVDIIDLAATVRIGTVTTLDPGSQATVTNSGDDQNVVLNFGIPAGEVTEAGIGSEVEVTTAGTVTVGAGDGRIAVNLASPGAVTLNLGAVSARAGLQLVVSDFGGNADITINAHAGETVMGLSSAELVSSGQGVGTGAAVTLFPNTTLSGWYAT